MFGHSCYDWIELQDVQKLRALAEFALIVVTSLDELFNVTCVLTYAPRQHFELILCQTF